MFMIENKLNQYQLVIHYFISYECDFDYGGGRRSLWKLRNFLVVCGKHASFLSFDGADCIRE